MSLAMWHMTNCQREGFGLTDVKRVSEDEVRSEISSKNIDAGVEVAILSE